MTRNSGAFAKEYATVEAVKAKTYTREEMLWFWSSLYDRLKSLPQEKRESAGGKSLAKALIDAYGLTQEGKAEEAVAKYGAQMKGLIVHLEMLDGAFGRDEELGGESLAVMAQAELSVIGNPTSEPKQFSIDDMFADEVAA